MDKRLIKLISFLKEKGIKEEEFLPYLKALEEDKENIKCELVYKNHTERGLEELKKKFPVLNDIKEWEIKTDSDKPTNILIEGDNLHSLQVLKATHKGLIDVIYIDPPYNTLNEKGFRYNDKMVDENDKDRHSKWLSFMRRRLELAWELLSDEGVIFVSIDDNEQAHLKLLMDDIFLEENFIANMTWHNRNPNLSIVSLDTEYIFIYAKNKDKIIPIYKDYKQGNWFGEEIERKYINPDNDKRGLWRSGGHTKTKNQNPYEYNINIMTGEIIEGEEETKPYYYYSNLWRYSPKSLNKLWQDNRLYWEISKGKVVNFKVKKFKKEELSLTTPQSLIPKTIAMTTDGKTDIKNIGFDERIFDYPKPVKLIKYLLKMKSKNAIILDFFAGSGTTGQAVLELNKEDGGNRQFILCTNNEVSEDLEIEHLVSIGKLPTMPTSKRSKAYKDWKKQYNDYKQTEDYSNIVETPQYQSNGICQAVTYQRIKKVIEGYTTPKGKAIEGIGGNLKYYKVDLIEKEEISFGNIKKLLTRSNEIISIKENCFNQIESNKDYDLIENEEKVVIIYKNQYATEYNLEEISKILQSYNKKKIIYSTNSEFRKNGIEFKTYPEWIIQLFDKVEKMD